MSAQENPTNLRHAIDVGEPITAIAWSPTGDEIAVGSYKTIRIFTIGMSEPRRTIRSKQRVWRLGWSHDGRLLGSAWQSNSVELIAARDGRHVGFAENLTSISDFAWSPVQQEIAISDAAGRLKLWSVAKNDIVAVAQYGQGMLKNVCWDPTGKRIAFGTDNGSTGVVEAQTLRAIGLSRGVGGEQIAAMGWLDAEHYIAGTKSGAVSIVKVGGDFVRVLRVIELGSGVLALVRLASERLLTVDESGQIRIWNAATGELLVRYEHPAFLVVKHPTLDVIAAPQLDDNSTLEILEIARDSPPQSSEAMSRYRNAKVVVVGESGSGKSGLSLVLAGRPFEPTLSTHGTHVFTLHHERVVTETSEERRELLLWDLAGQPGYRLTHQLHLNEVAVAVLVFDARHDRNPFADVPYWLQALAQAERLEGQHIRRFLVSARNDRSGVAVSDARLRQFLEEHGIDATFVTSARDGRGVDDLREAIISAIPWDELPQVTSSVMFDDMMQFVVEEKEAGRLLTKSQDLYRMFALRFPHHGASQADAVRQFDTCLGRLQSRGLVRRLRFGNLVLLQPEFLDAYASAIVDAARYEPDGLGSIAQDSVVKAQFRMPSDSRVSDPDDEKLLLVATVEDLVAHELAIRETADDGIHLVFPSQLQRENPDLPEPEGKAVTFSFAGPVLNIYVTLVVRLSHSGVFRKLDMWKDSAVFGTGDRSRCGVFLTNLGDGRADLTLFYEDTPEPIRRQFEDYVFAHLARRASSDEIGIRRAVVCGKCSRSQPDILVKLCAAQQLASFFCYSCGANVAMAAASEVPRQDENVIEAIDRRADAIRDEQTASVVLEGKRLVGEFDVFLCHNSSDKSTVRDVAEQLELRGVRPWFDEWQLRPGLPWQRVLEEQIQHIKTAAVFVGATGLGPWQQNEIDALLREFVKRGVPVIPVLLEEAGEAPKLPVFLQSHTWVDFRKVSPRPLDQLIWGVTGHEPSRAIVDRG